MVHRIELQETERATLEAAIAGRFVTNGVAAAGSVLHGMGNFLAPFSGVITAIGALWIAGRTWDELSDAAKESGSEIKTGLEEELAAAGLPKYTAFTSWLNAKYAFGGHNEICSFTHDAQGSSHFPPGSENIAPVFVSQLGIDVPQFFAKRMHEFLAMYCSLDPTDLRATDPVGLWMSFYSTADYGREAYYYAQKQYTTTQGAAGAFLKWVVGWA